MTSSHLLKGVTKMKRWLVRILKVLGGIIAVLVVLAIAAVIYVQAAWNRPYGRPVPQLIASTDKETVARGEYLFKYGNLCWGCHSPGTADANSAPVGGREFDLRKMGPGFGIFYSSNITPDPDTGIGRWSDGAIALTVGTRGLPDGPKGRGRLREDVSAERQPCDPGWPRSNRRQRYFSMASPRADSRSTPEPLATQIRENSTSPTSAGHSWDARKASRPYPVPLRYPLASSPTSEARSSSLACIEDSSPCAATNSATIS